MNHDKYKVSLGIAKRLKDVGYPQESEWYFVGDPAVIVHCSKLHEYKQCKDGNLIWARPDVGELGEMLPYSVRTKSRFDGKIRTYVLTIGKDINNNSWWTQYLPSIFEKNYGGDYLKSSNDKNEANARGLIYIYLAENGYLKKQEEYL